MLPAPVEVDLLVEDLEEVDSQCNLRVINTVTITNIALQRTIMIAIAVKINIENIIRNQVAKSAARKQAAKLKISAII